MSRRRCRKPLDVAQEHVRKGCDQSGFVIKEVSKEIGKGVFASMRFASGSFLLQYRGQLRMSDDTSDENQTFIFHFRVGRKRLCIDATSEDCIAKFINDEWQSPNCKARQVSVDGNTCLLLFAIKDIMPGEELRYDYGYADAPWRNKSNEVELLNEDKGAKEVNTEVDDRTEESSCSGGVEEEINDGAEGNVHHTEHSMEGKRGIHGVNGAKLNKKDGLDIKLSEKEVGDELSCVPDSGSYSKTSNSEIATETSQEVQRKEHQSKEYRALQHEGITAELNQSDHKWDGSKKKCSEENEVSEGLHEINIEEEQDSDSCSERSDNSEVDQHQGDTAHFNKEGDNKDECYQKGAVSEAEEKEVDNLHRTKTQDTDIYSVSDSGSSVQELEDIDVESRKYERSQGEECYGRHKVGDDERAKGGRSTRGDNGDVSNKKEDNTTEVEQHHSEKWEESHGAGANSKNLSESEVSEDDRDSDFVPDSHSETDSDSSSDNSSDMLKLKKVRRFRQQYKRTHQEEHQYRSNKGKRVEQQAVKEVEQEKESSDADEASIPCKRKRKGQEHKVGSSDIQNTERDVLDNDSEDEEEDVDESSITRANENEHLYVSKVLKSTTTKSGMIKKSARVFNSRHFCILCKQYAKDFSQHILGKSHSEKSEIKELVGKPSKERKRLMALLRQRGDHESNLKSIKKGRGEIILGRRLPVGEPFVLGLYGPCPCCSEWMKVSTLPRHQAWCIGREQEDVKLTKGQLEIQSEYLAGRITCEPSKSMIEEVFPIMRRDKIAETAKADHLIIALGNKWLEKNIGNRLMRKTYTSAAMRLVSRLLLNLRQLITPSEGWDLWNYISPAHFDRVVEAASEVCLPDASNREDMKSPSNGIKLSHDLKRVANVKLAHALKQLNSKDKQDAEEFLKLMDIEWSNSLQVALLEERKREKRKPLPLPADIQKLGKYIARKCEEMDLKDRSPSNFRVVSILAQAYLITYNRRRPGEVQAIRISTYNNRKSGVDDVHEELFNLTELEKLLVLSQEVIEIRGKRGKTVPVIVPVKAQPLLQFLADCQVRREAGRLSTNPYLFANESSGVLRGDYAVTTIKQEADLTFPERIQCTNLRKYMATLVQVMDINEQQHKYITDHLGHNLDVHQIYYRSTSDVIERLDLAKLLILLDKGKIAEYRGRKIEDVSMADILEIPVSEEGNNACEKSTEVEEDFYPDLPNFSFDENPVPAASGNALKKRKKKPFIRHRWTEEELAEVKKLFAYCFKEDRTPTQSEVVAAQKKSKASGGGLWKLSVVVVKSKVSWLRLHPTPKYYPVSVKMTQVGSKASFGYSARKMFGKDHHVVSTLKDGAETLTEDFESSKTGKKEFSEEIAKLLKYACILQTTKGKQFENVLGRLQWMLKRIGANLDIEDEESMDELYETLRDLILDKTHSKSSRWKIMELLELRANNWENAETISEYYENPANFMMRDFSDNMIKSSKPPPVPNMAYHPNPYMMYIPSQSPTMSPSPTSPPSARSSGSSTGYFTFKSPPTSSPEDSRMRRGSGSSSASRTASSDGGRSRNASGGSIRTSNYPRRGSGVSSRQSVEEEDVFHDAEESFATSSKNSSDSTDDSDENSDDGDSRSPAVTPAKYRLMQINSGKPIKYTRNFLLGCWSSPHTKVMPSTLQHTIANSDIAYIITGPPFVNPICVIATDSEPTTKLQAKPMRRALSLPAEPTSVVYQPAADPVQPFTRSVSVSQNTSPRDIAYYELPQGISSVQKAAVPMLLTDAWQRMFKDALRQIDGHQ